MCFNCTDATCIYVMHELGFENVREMPGMVDHACNPSTRDCRKLEANLSYSMRHDLRKNQKESKGDTGSDKKEI